ncbi:MAG: ATP-binding protein, partial [Bacteroidota bacterium]
SLEGQRFGKETELHFFRIIRELINNSIKHADASVANLRLTYFRKSILLVYWDNGKGYEVKSIMGSASGMGISNLYSRVSAMGGEIDFLNKKGKTYVRIRKSDFNDSELES